MLLAIFLLGGCQLSYNEAELVWLALLEPSEDIAESLIAAVDETELDYVDQGEDPPSVIDVENLSLSSGAGWEGLIALSGSKTIESGIDVYTINAQFTDVYVLAQDVTINGTPEIQMTDELDLTDHQSWNRSSRFSNRLEADGDAQGWAECDFSTTLKFAAETGQFTRTAEGSFAGHDVSQFID